MEDAATFPNKSTYHGYSVSRIHSMGYRAAKLRERRVKPSLMRQSEIGVGLANSKLGLDS